MLIEVESSPVVSLSIECAAEGAESETFSAISIFIDSFAESIENESVPALVLTITSDPYYINPIPIPPPPSGDFVFAEDWFFFWF